jgi:hypothetical protein
MLESNCKKEKLKIFFEFTALRTSQQNSIAERVFAVPYGFMRIMLKTANLKNSLKYALWTECANTATNLNNIIKLKTGIPYSAFHKSDPKFIKNLHTFDQKAVINNASPIYKKLKDKGIRVMFVGYAKEHAKDVFCFFNTKTNKIVISREVV